MGQQRPEAMGGSEAELREALAAARACGSDVDILAEAEARLCTLAAETELLSAMELVQSLEMSGAVDEELGPGTLNPLCH